jgi:hypothetical protein
VAVQEDNLSQGRKRVFLFCVMMRFIVCVLLLTVYSSPAYVQNIGWSREEIDKKLREVFPNAESIYILDSLKMLEAQADTTMPFPSYKALVVEREQPGCALLFYFYNASVTDSSSSAPIFRTVIKNLLISVFGTKTMDYIFSLPQFDNTGSRLMVYAIPLYLSDDYDFDSKEKAIRKFFNLQKMELVDIKLSDDEYDKEDE